MPIGDIIFLCVVVGALTLFGGVLAWACWMEAREKKQVSKAPKSAREMKVGRIPSGEAGPKVPSRPF